MLFRFVAPLLSLPLAVSAVQAPAQTASSLQGDTFHNTAAELQAVSTAHPAVGGGAATVLFEETAYRYAADGSHRYQHRLIYRIDTQAGVESWGEASADWDPWYQKPSNIRARVLTTAGTFVELDPKTITDAPINSDEQDTYTSQRIRKAPLPGMAVGSIVEEEETVDDKRAFSKTGSTQTYFLLRNVPAATQRVVVEVPSGTPFQDHIENMPSLHAIKQEKDGVIEYTYTATDLPASINDDIDITSGDDPRPRIQFSTGTSWAAVTKEYLELSRPATSADLSGVAQLPPAGKDRISTVRALVQYLHTQVRYTGVEFDEAQFVPGMPSETLKRHYGDCKDKAALLVALLHHAGITAHLALLKSGHGIDTNPAMPSLNRFDHAIVYVPASGNDKALWIDATANFNEVGSVPYMDTGRQALIIADNTTALTQIPEAVPADSVLIETREFFLPSVGKSRVVETSETHGSVDAAYRSDYGSTLSDQQKKQMEDYAWQAYLSKSLKSIDHSNGADLSKPFHLTLTMEDAGRGVVTVGDAAVAVYPFSSIVTLPSWLRTEETPTDTPEAKALQAKMIAARSATYLIQPAIVEKRNIIHLPQGFVARALPADRTTVLGHGTLKESFTQTSPDQLTYTARYDSGSGTLTAAEALAMRDAVLQVDRRGPILVVADEAGMKLLAEGNVRAAIELEKKASAAAPKDATPHVRLSKILMTVGLGDVATAEAEQATKLDPKSYAAWALLAANQVRNSLSVRFGEGFQRDAAIASYDKVLALKPDSDPEHFDQAVTQEFSPRGIRYADPASLKKAIASYQAIIARDPQNDRNDTYHDNLAIDLFLDGQFDTMRSSMAKLQPTPVRRGLLVAAEATQHGASAGLAELRRVSPGGAEQLNVIATANQYLLRTGHYTESVALMEEQIKLVQPEQASNLSRTIDLFRSLKRAPLTMPSGNKPTDPVTIVMQATLADTLTRDLAASIMVRNAYVNEATYQYHLKKTSQVHGIMKQGATSSGLAESTLADVLLSNMKVSATGDDTNGYIVVMESLGAQPKSFFAIHDGDRYRVVAEDDDAEEVGAYALYALDHGKLPQAIALLNWKRDHTQRGNSDDALAGPLLPRFWKANTAAADATPDAIRLAALSQLADIPAAAPLMSAAVKARESITPSTPHAEQLRTALDLLLVHSYRSVSNGTAALPLATELLDQEPDSDSALMMVTYANALNHTSSAWAATLEKKLATKPTNLALLRALVEAHSSAGDFKAARGVQQRILESGRATEADYNQFAWLGLFSNDLGEDTMKAARQAVTVGNNRSFASLHTLASIYAAQGKIAEADQTLKQAMAAAQLETPNAACWYVIGVIERQLGLTQEAIATFKKMDPRNTDFSADHSPTSTYVLAQQELAALTK